MERIQGERSSNGTPLFNRVCSGCGKESLVDKRRLDLKCLKCALSERKKHGLSKHPIYRVWNGIKVRCIYKSATNYDYYGGRGVKLCKEWEDLSVFYKWALENGWEKGLEVDRINPDGDYSPENCRIVNHQENSQSTRRIKTTLLQAKKVKNLLSDGYSVKDAAKKAGVSYMVAWHIKNSIGVWSNA